MIYLDSAATSLLKPQAVGQAVERSVRVNANPGRGTYASAMKAAETVYTCREEAAALFNVSGPENVVFTMNATHALNIAIHSLVKKGMRVVVSGYEHNAVVRPLTAAGADMDIVSAPPFDVSALLDGFKRRIPRADAVVCTHVSNVFGYILPIGEIAALCRKEGVPLIVDASQSAGVLDVDFSAWSAAFCAMPGHKGLMGPQGTGILLCRETPIPLLYGGTGSASASPDMPDSLPDRLEAGTQNVCGIAGLLEGIRFIRRTGLPQIRKKEEALIKLLSRGLSDMEGIAVVSPEPENRSGIISVIPMELSCEELASRLGKQGVAVRSGLHCAPQAHRTAQTADTGTVRFSVSFFNTPREIQKALEITKKSLKNNNKL